LHGDLIINGSVRRNMPQAGWFTGFLATTPALMELGLKMMDQVAWPIAVINAASYLDWSSCVVAGEMYF
jgi:hypothetical protein